MWWYSDWGFLTLIVQDSIGGLQLFQPSSNASGTGTGVDGRWIDIPAVSDAIVVNCGDYLSLLTGGRFRSPLHRVVTGEEERFSAVFFYYPNFDAQIEPLTASGSTTAATTATATATASVQDYSLLADQNQNRVGAVPTAAVGNSNPATAQLSRLPFGQYIANKWAQVNRSKKDAAPPSAAAAPIDATGS